MPPRLDLSAHGRNAGIFGCSTPSHQGAFNVNGITADIVYTIEKGSFAQDIVITGRLDPMDYGFSTNGARLQLYTELYDPPEPERVRQPIRVEQDKRLRDRMVSPDLVDEMLGFGEFVIATGRAVIAGTPRASGESAAPVVKELVHREGRTFLLESVEFASVETELKSLPDRWVGALDRKGARLETHYAAIPAPNTRDGEVGAGGCRRLRQPARGLASLSRMSRTRGSGSLPRQEGQRGLTLVTREELERRFARWLCFQ